ECGLLRLRSVHCFIITTVSGSRDHLVSNRFGTQVVDDTGIVTCTETLLPLGASKDSANTLPLGSVTTIEMLPNPPEGLNFEPSKLLSVMMFAQSVTMSLLPLSR